ncbi:MAG: molybdopterin-dependent oxidoreductase [Thermodesulfobacteriota bacterium]|nr:molybdopterin-dependent oxidoreductase [Thermodesulfobacteriota bacterium]
MENRRQFFRKSLGIIAGIGIFFSPLALFIRNLCGEAKRIILPKGTKKGTLIQRDPKTLDTRNLELTPLKDFRTMGTTDYKTGLSKWRLIVEGSVKTPLKLKYEEVKALPSIEKNVLLICPGVFVNHGRWKGVDMQSLLQKAKIDKSATRVTFSGPEGELEKVDSFSIDEVRAGKIFLAYEVNGRPLPRQHGFPLRLVAEDHYGSVWVKYVHRVNVENKNLTSERGNS